MRFSSKFCVCPQKAWDVLFVWLVHARSSRVADLLSPSTTSPESSYPLLRPKVSSKCLHALRCQRTNYHCFQQNQQCDHRLVKQLTSRMNAKVSPRNNHTSAEKVDGGSFWTRLSLLLVVSWDKKCSFCKPTARHLQDNFTWVWFKRQIYSETPTPNERITYVMQWHLATRGQNCMHVIFQPARVYWIE